MPGFYSTGEEREAADAEAAAAAARYAELKDAGEFNLPSFDDWLAGGEETPAADSDPVVFTTPEGREIRQSQVGGLTSLGMGGDDFTFGSLDDILRGVEQTGQIGQTGQDFGTVRPPEAIPDAPVDPREEDFGDDLDWLNPEFLQEAPTREQALSQGLTADDAARGVQMASADELFGLYQQGGRNAQDRAARAKARKDTEGWLRGQREADMQNLAERGMSGSGAEIATLLGDRQDAGERMSSADLTADAQAEQRALDALLGGTDIAQSLQRSADDYVQRNADRIANVEGANKGFLQKAYGATQVARDRWNENVLNQGLTAATNKVTQAEREGKYGYDQGTDLATQDAGAFNEKQGTANATSIGAYTGYTSPAAQAAQGRIAATGGTQKASGAAVSAPISSVLGFFSRGSANSSTPKKEEEQK